MGCSDSKEIPPLENNPGSPAKKNNKQSPQELDFDHQIPITKVKDTFEQDEREVEPSPKKKKAMKKKAMQGNQQEKIGKGGKGQKQNVVKVKKAKEIESQAQHNKFIESIIHRSKNSNTTLLTEHPMSAFGKPIVEYSPQKKGAIFGKEQVYKNKSHWSKPISEPQRAIPNNVSMGDSYVGVNEAPKSPYKVKQIERRLNQMRREKTEVNTYEFQLGESNKTVYL